MNDNKDPSLVIDNTQDTLKNLDEENEAEPIVFNNKDVRKNFIKKVYFIVLVQLAFTIAFSAVFMSFQEI